MIRSKIKSVGFSIVLIIIVALVSIGIIVAYYVSQTMGGANKLTIFKNTVNEMISLAENFYGGSWFALDNETSYAIQNDKGGYDLVYMNGTKVYINETAATSSQNLFYAKELFLPNTQSNELPKTGMLIILSNSTKYNESLIIIFGYYWNSVPNPAQEAYERILNESKSNFYGVTIGKRGNNIWIYSGGYDYGMYAELGQNVFITIITRGINVSSDQLQAFASKAEDLLEALAS
jgi:hypothetical protein